MVIKWNDLCWSVATAADAIAAASFSSGYSSFVWAHAFLLLTPVWLKRPATFDWHFWVAFFKP